MKKAIEKTITLIERNVNLINLWLREGHNNEDISRVSDETHGMIIVLRYIDAENMYSIVDHEDSVEFGYYNINLEWKTIC